MISVSNSIASSISQENHPSSTWSISKIFYDQTKPNYKVR
jgi:hypothetical protein